jgi:Taurine catabolism dioxygenase TauD, TfdA family
LWHVDSSFNPRRASYSLLLAHILPENGSGDTHFADTRTAYKNLPQETKDKIEGLKLAHSLWHSRGLAAPGFVALDHEAKNKPGAVHDLVQTNINGQKTMYVAAHASHVVGWPKEEGFKLIWELIDFATQPDYVLHVAWENPGDLVIWDNRSVMHRATEFEGQTKYPRDMRRTTVHDGSPSAFGYNTVYINNGVYTPTQTKPGMGSHTYAKTNGERCLTNAGDIDGDWYMERPDLGLPKTTQKKRGSLKESEANGHNKEITARSDGITAH